MFKQRNIWMIVLTLFILTAYSQPLHVTTKQIKYTNELMEVDLKKSGRNIEKTSIFTDSLPKWLSMGLSRQMSCVPSLFGD